MTLAQLVTPDTSELRSWLCVTTATNASYYLQNIRSSSQNPDQIQSVMGVTSALVCVAAPAIAAIGLSAMFIKWITGVYQRM